MLEFQRFCEAHGLIVTHIKQNEWVRVPTVDHPRKRNGAYKFAGDIGFVQNHATETEVSIWRSDKPATESQKRDMQAARLKAEREIAERQEAASKKAGWILHQCQDDLHPYLSRKGFPDATGLVWEPEPGAIRQLCIPMYVDRKLVGVQMISEDGDKKFLYGQRTSGAAFIIDNKGIPILCEGYATGLSIRAVMSAIKLRYKIVIGFSANNLLKLAAQHPGCVVVADNDRSGTGQRVASATGRPYWLSDFEGEDFNDYYRRVGVFAASQSLRKVLDAAKFAR